jgi:mono/diheme cytochrome c family protein
MRRALLLSGLPLLVLALGGCRNDMHHQAKITPFRESAFFPDGASARALPEGTIARGFLRADAAFARGQGPDGKFVEQIPVPLTRNLLVRGQERFDIFCSPCHGRTGEGQGMIVQRGFKRPPSYHVDRLRAERAGYFFDVITNGFGQMSSYAMQVTPEDRWAIVAWIRLLQASQHMPGNLLEREDREELDKFDRGRISRMTDVKGLGPQSGAQSARSPGAYLREPPDPRVQSAQSALHQQSRISEEAPRAAAHQAPSAAGAPPPPSSTSGNSSLSSSPTPPSQKSSLSSETN